MCVFAYVRLVGVEGGELVERGLGSSQTLIDQLHLRVLPALARLHDHLPLQLRHVLQDVADETVGAALCVLAEGAGVGVQGGAQLAGGQLGSEACRESGLGVLGLEG
jgi:hypothetical protein